MPATACRSSGLGARYGLGGAEMLEQRALARRADAARSRRAGWRRGPCCAWRDGCRWRSGAPRRAGAGRNRARDRAARACSGLSRPENGSARGRRRGPAPWRRRPGDAGNAEPVQHLAGDAELPAAAVDQHQVGPRRELVARRVGLPGVRLGIRFEHGQLRLG